jgi:CHAT domain-containing protein
VERVARLAPLPETTDELCAVADSLRGGDGSVILGADATETRIRAASASGELAQVRILHFATHGLVTGELNGLAEPALVLTPPPEATAADDGLLTASEVSALQLDADWVILSACNTAAGEGGNAEALSGLARSFFYAGARALLVSHWPVNSVAAVELTTAAVRKLEDGSTSRAEALRQAMLAQIAQGGARADPAYWGPFVVIGADG